MPKIVLAGQMIVAAGLFAFLLAGCSSGPAKLQGRWSDPLKLTTQSIVGEVKPKKPTFAQCITEAVADGLDEKIIIGYCAAVTA